MILSDTLLPKLGSFENVDSISFDPHKALVVPQQASMFLCKHPGTLLNFNQVSA